MIAILLKLKTTTKDETAHPIAADWSDHIQNIYLFHKLLNMLYMTCISVKIINWVVGI